MKQIIHLFIFTLILSPAAWSQSKPAVDPDKYRINLPDYWKPGNKVWEILDEKLPEVAEELKNKQLCGDDCRPKYTIEFEMSEPEIIDYHSNHISAGTKTSTWEFVTLYSFSSSLYLFDEKDQVLTKFILVDTNEVWRVVHKVQLPSFTPKAPMRISVLRPPFNTSNPNSSSSESMYWQLGNPAGQGVSPYSYINNNRARLNPSQRDMFNVVDRKIRSW